MKNITKELLISEFWRWVNEHGGKIPKREDMKIKDGYPNSKTYTDFLNIDDRKWKPVLDFVGAKRPTIKGKRREYKYDNLTNNDIIKIVQNRAKELNKIPRQEDFGGKYNLISSKTIINKLDCKTWNDVLLLCGVGETKERNYNKEEALNNLKKYIESIGYAPTFSEMKKIHYKPSMTWFTRKFGTYENALNLIGYKTILSNKDLLQILKDFYKQYNRSPFTSDMKNSNGFPSTEMYYGRFKTQSWNEILKLAGLDFKCADYDKEYGENFGINRLVEFYNLLGRLPKSEDFKTYSWTPSIHYYIDKYGGLINSLYKAKLINKPLSNEERIDMSIQTLINLSNELKRCPTVDEFDSIEHNGFKRRELERKLGIKYNKICKKYLKYKVNIDLDVTSDEIVKTITEIKNKLGRPPMFKELKKHGCGYSQSLFTSKFGFQYNNLIRSLGWIPTGSDTLQRTKEEMLDDFYNYFLQLGHIPSFEEITNNVENMASHGTYIKYFDSIENVCELLDIDYSLYYTGKIGAGRICFDNKGYLCRSLSEQKITNYLIENNITYEKESSYSEIIPNCHKRFDWKIYQNSQVYYVEYFGMYNSHSKSKVIEHYKNRTHWKIKQLCKRGYFDNCIFIFPNDLKSKSLNQIFKKVLI